MKISVSQEVKDNAKWRLGDVIADNSYSELYLIVKDNTGFDTVVTYLGNDMWTTEEGGHLR